MNPFTFIANNSALFGVLGVNTILAYAVFVPLSMGQFQVAQPVFCAIGGYAAGDMAIHTDLAFVPMLAIAVVLTSVVSLAFTPMLLRLSGLFLGLASFVLVGLAAAVAINLNFVGGALGLYSIPVYISSKVIWIMAVVVIAVVVVIRRSRFGLAMRVLRDDPIAAQGTGLSAFRINVYVFALSAAIAALAGIAQAYRFHTIGPDQFDLSVILAAVTYVIVGGLNNAAGPLVGSLIIGFLTNELGFLQNWQTAFNGAFLLVVVVFFPGGLTAIPPAVRTWLRERRTRPPDTPVILKAAGTGAAAGKVT